MTLTIELDLDSVKMNQRARYLGQRSNVIIRTDRHTDTQIALAVLFKVAVSILH